MKIQAITNAILKDPKNIRKILESADWDISAEEIYGTADALALDNAIKDAETDFKKFYVSRGQLVSLKQDKIQAKLAELEDLYENLCILSSSLAKKYKNTYEKFKNILTPFLQDTV